MNLLDFAHDYGQLTPNEQTQFQDSLRHLMSDGFLWRENSDDRRAYNFIARHTTLVRTYLQAAGWDVIPHERLGIFQLAHLTGAHRRALDADLTKWLLVARLIYAEKLERREATLTTYPTITTGDWVERYAAFFGGKLPRVQTAFRAAVPRLRTLKLIRFMGSLRPGDEHLPIELLPTLEVVVPADSVALVLERLRELQPTNDDDDAPTNMAE